MFKGLKFRERVKFWWENKIWLKKVKRSITEEQYGMIIYEEKDGSGIYGAYRSNGKNVIIQISEKDSWSDNWSETICEIYDDKKKEGYIFGTRKILYKPNGKNWAVIYKKRMASGMYVNMNKNLVIIFKQNEKDEIYRINKEQALEETLVTGEIIYINAKIPYKRNVELVVGNMEVMVFKNEEYYFYGFTENDLYDPNLKFFDSEEVNNFLSHKPAKAYSGASMVDHFVTLVDGKVKEHGLFDEVKSLGNDYYYSRPFHEFDAHLLKYINKEEIIDLGIIPKEAVYGKVEKILGIDFIVAKHEKGIFLLAINGNNELKTKFYEDAVDIKLAEPILFENGNVMEIKQIAVYEKLIEEN